MPVLNQKVGIGLNIARNTIGISERLTIDGAYAYRLRLANGIVGLGVQASIRYFENDFTNDALVSTVPMGQDGAISGGVETKYVPNFGAGAYFSNQRLYVGLSIPRILQNNIDFNETGTILSREVAHVYLMAGYLFKVSENVAFKPQILMKYVTHSPFDADVNASFIFMKKYFTGLTYRVGGSSETGIGESVDLMVGAQITNHLLFGFSYDFTLSDLKDYSSNGIEGVVRYYIGSAEGNDIVNPRFF